MPTPLGRVIRLAASPTGRKAIGRAVKAARSPEGRKLIAQARKVAQSPEGRKLIEQAKRVAKIPGEAARAPETKERLAALRRLRKRKP